MRYMLLIYSKEQDAPAAELAAIAERHRALMAETKRRGILVDASPLEPTATATTVRIGDGRPLIVDGPFAETKEQLAGYYILDCRDLDEAIEWATKIPTSCQGGEGCVEIRPFRVSASSSPAAHG
jgi:hypothetical protein